MGNEIENLQAILQTDPSNFQARRELAILLADNGFHDEALSNLLYLAKYFPEDAELQYNIGILYEKLKNFKNAKKAYIKAIKILPQEDFYYNLGEVLVNLQEWDEAIDSFKKVLATDPRDGNSYFNLGICYYNKDEINLAMDFFQEAININPQDLYAHFYLGYIYQNNGLTNFAVESYTKVLEISPDYSWAYFNLASIAYKNENIEEAKSYLLKTIEYNNNDIEAYKLLAKIYINSNETEEIIEILENRLKDDFYGDLYYILGQAYKHIGNLEKYKYCLKKAIESKLTLSYPHNIVEKELAIAIGKDSLDVNEVAEYISEENNDEIYEENDEIEETQDNETEFYDDKNEDFSDSEYSENLEETEEDYVN